ncbi:MAG TPA: orotate phosphoribosyltransferase [Steroidobacteraceae bacterium]|nr:orotate phosphoribosyltransferase [Steroidobacteraceae bacterium]
MNRDVLRDLIEDRALEFGHEYTLATGEKSNFYFDCKKAMLEGQILAAIADALIELIRTLPVAPTAIGGLTMGADFVSAAVAMRASQIGAPTVHASIVRKEPKKHGTRNYIENQLPEGTRIVAFDDVITSGSSTRKACEQFLAARYELVGILALVDREAGGRERLQADFNCPVLSLYRKSEFPKLIEAERRLAQAPR